MKKTGRGAGAIEPRAGSRLPSQRSYHACGRHFPNGVIVMVGHINIAGLVGGYAPRKVKSCGASRAIGAAGDLIVTSQDAHDSARSYLKNCEVELISHIYIARAVYGRVAWKVEAWGEPFGTCKGRYVQRLRLIQSKGLVSAIEGAAVIHRHDAKVIVRVPQHSGHDVADDNRISSISDISGRRAAPVVCR